MLGQFIILIGILEKNTYRCHLKLQVILLLQQRHHLLLKLLLFGLSFGQVFLAFGKVLFHGGQLLLSLSTLQERLDLVVHLHPWPVFDIHE